MESDMYNINDFNVIFCYETLMVILEKKSPNTNAGITVFTHSDTQTYNIGDFNQNAHVILH